MPSRHHRPAPKGPLTAARVAGNFFFPLTNSRTSAYLAFTVPTLCPRTIREDRMKRRMEQVEVSVSENGKVMIEQPDEMNPEFSGSVELQPEQVDMVCEWLKAAKEEALRLRASSLASADR